ncbi:MAG TPA: glycoside hydrolase family 9 protein [Sediminibacterium sp.]|nr:glycoside hydrolase family 9 protein [Sediminibacterium sp.]
MKSLLLFFSLLPLYFFGQDSSWIRINQLGYARLIPKQAVWCTKGTSLPQKFELQDAATGHTVFTGRPSEDFGAYGPFLHTMRLDFSPVVQPGVYRLYAGDVYSPVFVISDTVYRGAADFCLRYMRQQRSGFNPFLRDSCHTHDGYTLYGPMPDSTFIPVTGGWHDASDYLQYSTTSANAIFHLLAAYRDFPDVFTDKMQANGLPGSNGLADVLDEAKWGLDWLQKMFPRPDWMFNQVGDDRDHMGMRIPGEDAFYGKGFERPVYFVSGKPQQRGKFLNASTGAASTAGKFASAFALAEYLRLRDTAFARKAPAYSKLAVDAYHYGQRQPGVAQTASVRSPYIYAEDNWTDDMELAAACLGKLQQAKNKTSRNFLTQAMQYAVQERVTPWLGADTAKHYQWYPFIYLGHAELAEADPKMAVRDSLMQWYRTGIERVWVKAKQNAFYRGIPFIWCSNNLTVSFAIQCYWYARQTGDRRFEAFAQSNFDWLFGCNPWGTSMVYGLPTRGDTPEDPHSAFTHLKHYPIDGGLVDGPVYTSIYQNLIGIHLENTDEYAAFQSGLAVYHDDYGDYSTNEPTMDGTASLIYLLAAKDAAARSNSAKVYAHGAIIRGDSSLRRVSLVFTADSFAEGLPVIMPVLKQKKVPAAFFFTGNTYRNPAYQRYIRQLAAMPGILTGLHSDQHLLYCDWTMRDQVLVTKDSLRKDLDHNLAARTRAGLTADAPGYFIPPYEWWNDTIAAWIKEKGLIPVCFTPGTGSNADYTYPAMGKSYKSTETILAGIRRFAESRPAGLNGVILLIHAGTDPRRKDKLYHHLGELVDYLQAKGYTITSLDALLKI